MKLALLQCNVINGNLAANVAKIAQFCATYQADVYLAPLGCLLGPTITENDNLIRKAEESLHSLAKQLNQTQYLILGNALGLACLVHNGKKQLIKGAFRLFDYTIDIGLDSWKTSQVQLLLGLDQRPFFPGSQNEWELILSGIARTSGRICVSVNLVGGYGQHIYNGQSVCADASGNIITRAKAFEEDCLILDLTQPNEARLEAMPASESEEQWRALVLGVRDFIHKTGCKKAVLGLSGGMDSAIVACVAKEALGSDNVLGVLMPSPYTSPESIRDAEELAQNLGIKTCQIAITPMFDSFRKMLKPVFAKLESQPGNLTEENLQARIRGVILMAISNQTGALVLNTGNLSEALMGYSTLYGDTVGAIGVIGDLFKTRVYALAQWYCQHCGSMVIPQNVFDRPPTAELAPNQKDTDSLPPYDQLDPMLAQILCGHPEGLDALQKRVAANAFKRRLSPPPLLVGKVCASKCGE